MRLSLPVFLSAFLIPTSGMPATIVAQYDATSIVSVSIAAAYYESTGLDAMADISPGFYDEQNDTGIDTSGAGEVRFIRDAPLSDDLASFTAAYGASGYADTTTNSASFSEVGGYLLPTYAYSANDCVGSLTHSCSDFDPIILDIAYHVETTESVDIFDPLTGSADATAIARLTFSYSEFGYSPSGSPLLDVSASGNEMYDGIFNTRLEPGSALFMFLYAAYAGGSATYTPPLISNTSSSTPPPVVTPLPHAVPLMLTGMAAMALVLRRRPKA